jgi:tRNA/rRNA methyltransferase
MSTALQTSPWRTRFILLNTSHAGNVGAAARAIKVMGFSEMVLVAPRWPNVLRREETIQRASGALDVLTNARIVDTLDEALDGMTHLCATAMTPRDFGPPTVTPREHFESLLNKELLTPINKALQPDLIEENDLETTGNEQGMGFLFGSERFGMTNEDVYRCHACLSIPTNPSFGSLNLAAALQVIAYDWRLALGGFVDSVRPEPSPSVRPEPVEGLSVESGVQAEQMPGAHTLRFLKSPPTSALPTPLPLSIRAELPRRLADAQQVAGMLKHLEQALIAIDFLDPAAPKKLMPRLNQLFNRAEVTQEEIHILRGVAKAMLDVAARASVSAKG